MSENMQDFVLAVAAIKSDEDLKAAFVKVLEVGSYTQQVRVAKLIEAINETDAPQNVKNFIQVLAHDKMAHMVLRALNQ